MRLAVFLISISLFSLNSNRAFSQADFTQARHETLSQQDIDVSFDQAISFSPLPATSVGWSVTIGGTAVPITSIGTFGPTTVRITFDASGIAGHGGTQAYLKPGEVLRVSYNGTGNLTSIGGVTAFANQQSLNQWVFTCDDVEFKTQGIIPADSQDNCVPVVMDFYQWQFSMSLRMRNSSNFTTALDGSGRTINSNFFYNFNWGDATGTSVNPYLSDVTGASAPSLIENTVFSGSPGVYFTSRPTKNYPATTTPAPNICSWDVVVRPFWIGIPNCNGDSQTTIFNNWDTDNANTGVLNMPFNPPGVGETSDRICLGNNVNMRFTDQTQLNCRLAAPEANNPNQAVRHIRIVYGSTNYAAPGNIPDIHVGGVQVTNSTTGALLAPYNANPILGGGTGYVPTGAGGVGVPDFNGVIQLPTPVLTSTLTTYMQQITTLVATSQVVGQRFYVRLDYWDICNPYNPISPDVNRVSIENYDEIIGKPVALTTAGQSICYTTPNTTAFNFTVASSIGGLRTGVNWYASLANVSSGTRITNPNGTNSLTFPASSYTTANGTAVNFRSDNVGGRYYSLWATQVQGGTNACESDPIEVVIYQQPQINAGADNPTTPVGSTQVCINDVQVYTTSAPGVKTIAANNSTNGAALNFQLENLWSDVFGADVSVSPTNTTGTTTSATFSFAAQPNPSTTNNISVRRRYRTTDLVSVVSPLPAPFTLPTYTIAPQTCQNNNVSLAVTVFGESNGGTIAGSPTICDGSSTGNMILSGHRGSVLQWERSYDDPGPAPAGAFIAIAGTGGLTTFSEIPPNGPGTYKYRVLVQNQNITGPCPSATTIVANQNTVVVNPVPPKPTITPTGATTFCFGGSVTLTSSTVDAARYDWYRGATLVQSGASNTIVLTTVAQSGSYTVQTFGIAPSNCPSIASDPEVVTINPLPVAANPTGGGAVCSGNPAPDIEWAISNGTGPYAVTYTITKNPGAVVSGPFVVNNVTSPFLIDDPNPVGIGGDTFDYKITNIQDANGCFANPITLAAVPAGQVSIGGTAPVLDGPVSLSLSAACDDGGSTSNPQLVFGLTVASANTAGFILNYTVDGGGNRTKNFNTDAAGDPTVGTQVIFSDAELNTLLPSPHVIRIVSIISPSTCQLLIGQNLNFTVNPRPSPPVNPGNVIACSDVVGTTSVLVNNPGAGLTVDWYDVPAPGGVLLANGVLSFVPGAAGTYYAETRNTTTGCTSTLRTAVTLTSDPLPSPANAGASFSTCSTSETLLGVPAFPASATGTWSVGSAIYYQTFSSADNNAGFTAGGSFIPPKDLSWTLNTSNGVFADPATDYIRVNAGRLEAQDVDDNVGGQFVDWQSTSINISAFPGGVDVSLDLSQSGANAGDGVSSFYRINGGALTPFSVNPSLLGAFAASTASAPGLIGNTLEIVVRIELAGNGQFIFLDNVFVRPSGVVLPSITDVNLATTTVSNLQVGANVFTWTVSSQFGVCSPTTSSATITRNPLPVALDPNPAVCESSFGLTEANGIDLTVYNDGVTGIIGSANRTIQYFSDPGRTILIGAPVNNVTHNEVFYTRVTKTDLAPNCTQDGIITIRVNPLPSTNDQVFEICEEAVSSADKDNNNLPILFNDLVTGIAGSTNRTVTWYVDPGVPVSLPSDLVTLVPTPSDVDDVTDGERFYAVVENTLTGCEDVAFVEFDIRPRPAANPISGSASVCAGTNIILYQIGTVVPGSTYSWNLPPDGAGFVRFAGGGPNDFFVLLQFPSVITPPNDSYNISVTETSPNPDACTGVANSLTITVETSPSPNPIIGPNPVCKTETEVYQVTTIDPLNTYQWSITAGDAAIVGPASGTGLGSITVDFGTSASSTIRVVEQSPTGCSIAGGQTLVVNANDQPTMTSPATATVCSGLAVSTALNFVASIPLSTFNWQVINVTGTVTGTALGNTGSGNIGQTIVNTTGGVASVTYRVTPTSPDGCQGPFQDVVVSITPQPVIVTGQAPIACSGEPVNREIFLTPLNQPVATIFDWPAPVMSDASVQGTAKNVAAGIAGTFHITDVLVNLSNAPITATYTVTPSNGLCNGAPETVIVTVNPEPIGVDDNTPIICSDALVNYNLSNNIATLGNNLITGTTYSWIATANPNVTGESVVAQSGATITDALSNTTASDQVVVYTVTPTSSLGCLGNTFTISVTVRPEPVATNDVLTICSDSPLTYNLQNRVNLSGNGLASNFTWLAASNANVTGESTALQNTGVITDVLTNVTNTDQVVVYTITPTGTNGCVGSSFTLTVTVRPEPVGADDSFTTCSDVALSYNLTNNITTLGNNLTASFSWVALNNPNVTGESTTPQAGNMINNTLTNITNSNQVVVYTVTPTGTNGCPGDDFTVSVTVQPEPRGVNDGPIDVCSNVAFNYSLQNNVNTLGNSVTANFTWSAAANGNVTGESTALQAGGTITDVLRNVTNSDELITYTVTPTGTNGCAGNSFTVTFRVQPEPVGVNDVKTICSDATVSVDLQDNVTTLGNNLTSNFSWQAAANGNVTGESTTPQASSMITDALSNITNSDQVVLYTVTPTGTNGCAGVPFTISVTVRPEPIGVNDAKTICSDEIVTYDLLSNVTSLGNGLPATFSWIAASNGNVLGESTSAQAGGMITDVLNNVTNTDQVVVYTITPTASGSGCVGSPFTITVTVRPEPKGTDAPKTICSDESVAFDLQLNVNTLPGNSLPATFSWVAASNGNVTGESIVPQAGNTINDVLNNVTNANQVVVYTVTPTGTNGCIGNPFTITVTVRPEPLGVNATKSICSDENVNVDLQNNVTTLGNNLPATFSWIASPNASVSGESTLPQAGASINDVLTNVTGSDQVVVYTVTPTSLLGCLGNSFTVTVTVQSEPTAPTGTGLICSDATVNFNLQNHVISVGNGQASTFSWIATSNGSVTGESTSPVVGSTITDVLNNISNVDQVVRYTVTPTGTNGCIGNAFFVDITVRSEPRGANAPATTCSDVALNIDLQNNISTLGNSQASTFSWVAAANGLVTGESVVPQASAFITDILTNKTGVDQTVVYTVTPTGTNGCVGDNFTITVTVQSEPTGDDDVVPICSDSNVNYDLQNNNVNVLGNSQAATFTWIATANPNVTGENTVLQTTSVINDVLNNVTGVNQTVVYTVTPTGTNGCLGDVLTVSITVRPEPLGVNDTKTICSDNNVSYNLQDNINNLGNSLISNFTWVAAANANVSGESTIAVAGNVINDNLNNVTSIDQVVVYTVIPTGTNGCVGNSFTVQVTVQPEPQGIAGTKTICSDLAVNYNLQTDNINAGGNNVASTFSWIAAANPNVTGESTTGQNTGTISDVLNNVTGIAQTVVYTVTPTGVNGCLGNDFTVTITVNPEPVGQNDTDTSCNVPLSYDIQASNINVFGNSVSSVFTYTVLSSDQPNVPAGPDRVGANALPITDSFTNSTGVDVFMTYTITPISSPNGCAGNTFTYIVTIKSRPIGADYTETPNVCSSVPFVVNPQTPGITNGVVSTFTWTAAYAPGLTGGVGAGVGTIGETLSNVGAVPLSVIYTVTPSAGPCQGPDFDITVIIDPQPVTDPSLATKTICSDLISNILLNTNGISVGATNWDVDVVSVDANLVPNAGNAVDPGLAEVANYIQNDRYTNVSFTPGNVIYKVTPIGPPATSCRGVDTFVTLTVNPEPVMNPALATPAPVCSDEIIGVSLSTNGTSVAAASYIFVSVSTFQAGNAAADPDETGPGDRLASVIQNDSYTNLTTAAFTRTYQIKPKSAAGCLGDLLNIPVQVLPEPDFTFTIPPPICSTDLIGLQLDTTPGSVQVDEYEVTFINWETIPAPGLLPGGSNIAIGSILPAVAGSFTINDSYVNGQNVSLNATYSIRPYAPTTLGKRCVGDVKQAVVGIRPSPIVLEDLDEIVCNDATNGILINTKTSSAPANSFEIVRPALPAGLSLGSYVPGTSVVTGNSTTAIANDRFVNTTNNPIPVIYTVRANTDAVPASGCFGPAEQVQVLVEPQILVTLDATTNLKPDICGGTDMTNIDLESPSNPSAGAVTFNFTVSPSISGAVPGTNFSETDFIEQALLNTTNAPINVTYSITPRANSAAGGLGCVGVLNTTVVSVRPSPKLTPTPANFTICEGEPLGVDFATPTTTGAGTSAVAFELIRVEDPNLAPAAPANGISGFNNVFPSNYAIGANVLNDVLTNSNVDGLQHSIRYAFIPKYTITSRAFECRGEESYVTVLVSPRATITGFDDINDAIAEGDPLNLLPGIPVEVCSGEPFDRKILFTGADAGSTNLSWTRVADAGVTGSSGGAGDILSQVLFNSTNTDVSLVTYTVTPKSFNCTGAPVNLVAIVLPVAKVGTLASTFKICADGTFEVDPIPSPTVNANFYWAVDNPDPTFVTLQSTTAQPGTVISDTWLNQSPTFDLASLTYTISPFVSKTTGQECFGTDKFVTVNDAFICEGDEELLTFLNNGLSKFSLKYSEGGSEVVVNNAGAVVNLFVTPAATTTYTLLSVTDSYGCEQTTFTGNAVVTVNVANTNADFTVPGAAISCSPFPVDFEYDQQNGIEYTWRWADGESDSVYVAGATVPNESVRHIFTNLSTSSTRSFKVELETRIPDGADADNNYPGGCADRSDKTVQVHPVVVAAVTVDKDAICSGETIQFRNSSRGVKSDTWFYRVQGSTGQLDVRTDTYTGSERPPSITSFTMENLISNPLVFEVVYQARNENCSAPDSVTSITVYRGMTADFTAAVLGPYIGGHAYVNVTNTSNPIDAVDFTYEWNFGEDAVPAEFNGTTPTNPLDYVTPGQKEISLLVTNILASTVGLSCSDLVIKTIDIEVPPLQADFDAIPLAACFPTDITIVDNRATGDVFEWEVIDEGGRTSATSNANLPVFAIPNPGKYTIFLTTRNSFTGDAESTSKELEIFELPTASFELRPTVVFIPDQQITTFNFSDGANQYEWDFGDGNTSIDFEPTFTYRVEGEYPVTLVAGFNNGSHDVDGDGVTDGAIICYDTLTRTVQAKDGGVTRIPNSFTPNPNGPNGGNAGNGSFNDVFLPITKGVEEFLMQIFDRWGNLVFESRDKNQGWDGYHQNGSLMPAGVYVYKLELRLSNGQRTNQVGDVTLIR